MIGASGVGARSVGDHPWSRGRNDGAMTDKHPLRRLEALEALYAELDDRVVVTIMGAVATELQSIGHKPNFFYLHMPWGWHRRWAWASRWRARS